MTITKEDPKKLLNYFLVLSLACLVLAGVFVIIDAIHGHFIIDDADYFLAFLGIICLALGLAASNKLEIELLKQQSKPEVEHE